MSGLRLASVIVNCTLCQQQFSVCCRMSHSLLLMWGEHAPEGADGKPAVHQQQDDTAEGIDQNALGEKTGEYQSTLIFPRMQPSKQRATNFPSS